MPHDSVDLIVLMVIGFFAGAAGGLLGIGGAIVVIPALTLFLHYDQHLSQAVAMIVNVFVAIPAIIWHHRRGAVRWNIVAKILPFTIVLVLVGVAVSDRVDGELLRRAFGLFLVYLVAVSLLWLSRDRRDQADVPPRNDLRTAATVGSSTGFLAGLLGIGGGPVAAPLLHRVCMLPVREAVGTSLAIVCITSIVGAARRNTTLAGLTDSAGVSLGLSVSDSLWLAACLIPTAMIGAVIGADLTHRVPSRGVRMAFLVLMCWAGVQMLGRF